MTDENNTPNNPSINNSTKSAQPVKKVKKLGPIRWNAIIPFTIIVAIFALYMHFFFDKHLKNAIEWGGFKALGAEVNVGDLKTSFFTAHMEIKNIQVTNAEKPTHNSIEVGDIRFGMLWDALLRAKAVVNEVAVENIKFGTKRASPGKVAPPQPPPKGPGFTEQMKDSFLDEAEKQYDNNVFGNLVALMKGGSSEAQLQEIENKLPSKKMAQDLEKFVKEKEKYWNEKSKTLPQQKEIQALSDRMSKVKYKDFKTPMELDQSIKEVDAIIKEGDAKYKLVDATLKEFNTDLAKIQTDLKALEAQIKVDVDTLKQYFKIPKLDAKSLGRAVFLKYLSPYVAKFNTYKAMAMKYLPPKYSQKIANIGKKEKITTEDEAEELVPHVRTDGVTYEFGKPNAYPLVWVKLVSISSQAGASAESGNVAGKITNITTNQNLIGKPTELDVRADFPAMGVSGGKVYASFDNRPAESIIKYDMAVGGYPIAQKELVKGDVAIAFEKAVGSMSLKGSLVGFKKFEANLNNSFSKIQYKIESNNQVVKDILVNTFKGIPVVTLNAEGHGELPSIDFNIETNLGEELQKGISREVNAKIEEAKQKAQKIIDEEIGKNKKLIEQEIAKFKSQYEGEIKKVQDQIEGQKKAGEQKINEAKKSAENQAQGALKKEGEKALEDIKKKLGW